MSKPVAVEWQHATNAVVPDYIELIQITAAQLRDNAYLTSNTKWFIRRDEMTPLYDLLEEANGHTKT